MKGRHQQRLEFLEACVAKISRGTPEQLEAQRAYADARRRAYFTALTEAIESGEEDSFVFEYPAYTGRNFTSGRSSRKRGGGTRSHTKTRRGLLCPSSVSSLGRINEILLDLSR
jgi:hypothetical protein